MTQLILIGIDLEWGEFWKGDQIPGVRQAWDGRDGTAGPVDRTSVMGSQEVFIGIKADDFFKGSQTMAGSIVSLLGSDS